MAKLTKAQFKKHNEAEALLLKQELSDDERWFVLEHWDPSARHVNSAAGAFFTPCDLAHSFALMLGSPDTIVDLCAGIGTLAAACLPARGPLPRIVCVEKNPDYVRVGRKALPEAQWIEADVFDALSLGLAPSDVAISNPPFGATPKGTQSFPGVTGGFEFHVVALAMELAGSGQFILPQLSAGFAYSGQPYYRRQTEGRAYEFQRDRGLHFDCCSIDTEFCRAKWRGTAPAVEVVSVERVEHEAAQYEPALEAAA